MITNCKNQNKKSCNWFILVYEDSVKKDYVNILNSLGVKCAISPVHDKDFGDNGDLLKPHRHILITFNGGRRLKDIESIIESINAYKHCEIVYDKVVAYQYLYHNEQFNKAPYEQSDIIYVNCQPYDFTNSVFKDILDYIDNNNCASFKTLTRKLRNDNSDKLLEYVASNTYYIQAYLKDTLYDKENSLKLAYHYLDECIRDIDEIGCVQSDKVQKLMEVFGGIDIE